MKQRFLALYLLLMSVFLLSGCQAMLTKTAGYAKDATEVTRSTTQSLKKTTTAKAGEISQATVKSAKKSTAAVAKSFEEFTAEQEYYIGRSVAAVLLTKYPPYANKAANEYLNLLGQTLAQASDMPEIFLGYRFLVLNSDEINAIATPGGHIFITRGLLRCCLNEDSVAAILAHEIGHIQLKHGIQAIKKARIGEAVSTVATESVRILTLNEATKVIETFGGAVSDITNMVNNGYSRSFEYAADDAAQTILRRVGYDPNGLVEMLKVMEQKIKPGETGFARTHPAPQDRIDEILKKTDGKFSPVQSPSMRQARFMKAIGNI
jgi:predicted Zn-dependent protease